jgi:hypothetical protein
MLTKEMKSELLKAKKGIDENNISKYLKMYRDCMLEGQNVVDMFQYLIDTGMIEFMNDKLIDDANDLLRLNICTLRRVIKVNCLGIDIKVVSHE